MLLYSSEKDISVHCASFVEASTLPVETLLSSVTLSSMACMYHVVHTLYIKYRPIHQQASKQRASASADIQCHHHSTPHLLSSYNTLTKIQSNLIIRQLSGPVVALCYSSGSGDSVVLKLHSTTFPDHFPHWGKWWRHVKPLMMIITCFFSNGPLLLALPIRI